MHELEDCQHLRDDWWAGGFVSGMMAGGIIVGVVVWILAKVTL